MAISIVHAHVASHHNIDKLCVLVSIAIKLREAQCRSFTNSLIVAKEWRDALCSFSHRLYFRDEVIQQLNNGLELGRLLDLPHKLACNFRSLGELFVGDTGGAMKFVRPLNHMM